MKPSTLAQIHLAFRNDPDADAAFGSYDLVPLAPNVLSQYRNLLHHFVHQAGQADADVPHEKWTRS